MTPVPLSALLTQKETARSSDLHPQRAALLLHREDQDTQSTLWAELSPAYACALCCQGTAIDTMATNANTMVGAVMGAMFVLAGLPTTSASPAGGSRKLLDVWVMPQGSSQGQVQQMVQNGVQMVSPGNQQVMQQQSSTGQQQFQAQSQQSQVTPQQQQQQQSQFAPQQQQQQQQSSSQQSQSSSSRSGQPSGKLSGDDPLQLTNAYRAVHGAPPLVWDTNLVAKAQNWANNLAAQCAFYHSGPGENLASGYPSWSDVIFGWYNEQKMYNYGAPSYAPSTGHFTQLVWQGTQKVGCAASRPNCQQGIVWSCEYDPVGNVNSAQYFQANVKAP